METEPLYVVAPLLALISYQVFNIFNGIWIDTSFSKLSKGKAILGET